MPGVLKFIIVSPMNNALSIDLEEYFQIHALSGLIDPQTWPDFPSSVEENTVRILNLLEERRIQTTFFCLGWIAEHHREVIRRIHGKGHEIACHGYAHQVIYQQDQDKFRNDVSRAKHILEDIIGEPVIGYRAPTYSITDQTLWALHILEEVGFRYDSSIFPIYHDNYGIPMPQVPVSHTRQLPGGVPISTLKLGAVNIPYPAGIFPVPAIFPDENRAEDPGGGNRPFVFYIHPWELNPDTPRVAGMDFRSRFRTYIGIERSFRRFSRLLSDFPFAPLRDVLKEQGLLT